MPPMLQPTRAPYGWHARSPRSSNCDKAQDYVYRGKQFAAQNAFCNAGDSYPGSNCAFASDRYDTDRADRSADQQIAFVPLSASTASIPVKSAWFVSGRQSTSALKPSPKSRTRKTYVFWDLQITDLQSAAVAP